MTRYLKGILLIAGILSLVNCNGMGDFGFFGWGGPGHYANSETHSQVGSQACSQRGAYSAGVYAAKDKKKMIMDYGRACPNDQATLSMLYRQGYENGVLSRMNNPVKHPSWYNRDAPGVDGLSDEPVVKQKLNPYNPTQWHCFTDKAGLKKCGYYCQITDTDVVCTSSKHQRCVKNENGATACGYNCTSTAKSVKCAASPEEKCLSDSYGNIQCGDNCFRNEGQVICE